MSSPLRDAEKSRVPLELEIEESGLTLAVEAAELTQGLSEGFSWEVTVRVLAGQPEPERLLGRPTTVVLVDEPETPPLRGVCTSVRALGDDVDQGRLALTVEARTAFLRFRRDHRVFRDAKAPALAAAIVEPLEDRVGAVLSEEGGDLPLHEYRVQYGESDWDALRRLLADDGVTFIYDFLEAGRLRLVHDTTRLVVAQKTLPFLAGAGLGATEERVVSRVEHRGALGITAVRVTDEWIERPDFEATSVAALARSGATLEQYFFETGMENTEVELARQAGLRLAEAAAPTAVLEVVTNAFCLPGTVLSLVGVPLLAAECELLVVAARSRWAAGRERAEVTHVLTCIDRRRRWVPPRWPKPRIAGIQRATVVGEGELDVDPLGRVQCRFAWDRGRKVSRRVEVSQAWAGSGHGHYTLPRVGDQVLVAYLDGDPDEPVVVGRVHDAKNVHPLALPDRAATSLWRTRTTPGGAGYNEIGMSDSAGAERLWSHAQRDADHQVLRDQTGFVGRDMSVDVGRHTNVRLTGLTNVNAGSPTTWRGVDLEVDAHGHLKLCADTREDMVASDYTLRVGATYEVTVGSSESHLVPSFDVVSADHIMLTVGSFLLIKPGSITLGCGASTIVMTPAMITITSPLIELNP